MSDIHVDITPEDFLAAVQDALNLVAAAKGSSGFAAHRLARAG
jgi:hypothetical protein